MLRAPTLASFERPPLAVESCYLFRAMKLQMGTLGWTLLCASSVVIACGGSSEKNEGGGSSGKAGSSAAGSSNAGNGGSRAGNSSGGTTANGGSSNAGTSATGGSRNNGGTPSNGGTINIGGSNFDPSDFACDPAPEVGTDCEAGAPPCVNGTSVCYCDDASAWACMGLPGGGGSAGTGPIGDLECPTAKPMAGSPCGDSVGFCPYGSGPLSGCACYAGNWTCL